ncbi:hypothetical protein P43SY_002415 [Pythium insidiosum]|uniref:Uncharacterized protein n=1 Tax=Pythium insidiosum TaxID=114742 RepID=A0AAD5LYN8_PYTIN|nr:hypothetical protein P43SY_002415 [Pythium insidiosum]
MELDALALSVAAEVLCETSSPWERVLQETHAPEFHVDALDRGFVSRDGLSAELAWSLATRWSGLLRGVVHIKTDYHAPEFAVVPSYDWICIHYHAPEFAVVPSYDWICIRAGCGSFRDRDAVWSAIRSALLVWRALACCHGFSAREHPVFWKRVFETMVVPLRGPEADALGCCSNVYAQIYVSDAHRFFDGVPFPRAQLVSCWNASDATLTGDLSVLCGRSVGSAEVQAQLQTALQVLAPFVREERIRDAGTIETSMGFYRSDWQPAIDVAACLDVFHCQTESPGEEFSPAFSTFREYVLSALNPNHERPGGVRYLTLNQGEDERAFSAICSALPYATVFDTLAIDTDPRWPSLTRDDAAWLGYALFHPDTSSSTWRRLKIARVGDHISDKYHTAEIRAGAVIRSKPTEDDGYVVETLRETTEMDVCVESTDVSRLSEWVFVVVIGYGAAWVRREDVKHVVARAPGRPKLTELSVESSTLPPGMVPAIVALTRSSLQFLRLEESQLAACEFQSGSIPGISTCIYAETALPLRVRELSLAGMNILVLFRIAPALARLRDLETLSITVECTWDEVFLERVQELLQWLLPRFVGPALPSHCFMAIAYDTPPFRVWDPTREPYTEPSAVGLFGDDSDY